MAKKVFDGKSVVGGAINKDRIKAFGDSIADIKKNRGKIAQAINDKLGSTGVPSLVDAHTPQQRHVEQRGRHDTINNNPPLPINTNRNVPNIVNGYITFPECFDVKLPPVHIETCIDAALTSLYIYVMGVEDGIDRKVHRSLLELQDALPRRLFHDRTLDMPQLNYAPKLTYLAGYRTGACGGGCKLLFRYRNCGPNVKYYKSLITSVADFEVMLNGELLEWCVQ